MKKLDLHTTLALYFVLLSPAILAPALTGSTRADIGPVLAWAVVFTAVMIMGLPRLVAIEPFRRWYCWSDALSQRQKQVLQQRRLGAYYAAAYEDDYVGRLMPYVLRIAGTMLVPNVVVRLVVPWWAHTGMPAVDGAMAAYLLYMPILFLVILVTLPWGPWIRDRFISRR